MSDELLNDDEIQTLLARAQAGETPESPGAVDAGGIPTSGDSPSVDTGAGPARSAGTPGDVGAASHASSDQSSPNDIGRSHAAPRQAPPPAATPTTARPSREFDDVTQHANRLLDTVESGLDAALAGGPEGRRNVMADVSDARPFELDDLGPTNGNDRDNRHSMGSLDDVELDLHIELGRAELLIDEVLSLRPGAVVPLDKLAGDPVDIMVNGRLLARGEVLVLNDNFCVRIAEIIAPDF